DKAIRWRQRSQLLSQSPAATSPGYRQGRTAQGTTSRIPRRSAHTMLHVSAFCHLHHGKAADAYLSEYQVAPAAVATSPTGPSASKRAFAPCFTKKSLQEEIKVVTSDLRKNRYPRRFILRILEKSRHPSVECSIPPSDRVCVPYISRTSETLSRVLGHYGIAGFPEDGLNDGKFLSSLHYESKLASSAVGAPAITLPPRENEDEDGGVF
ncbi:hypothetical protein HPB47_024286, partial [Ixodes persulcatus]